MKDPRPHLRPLAGTANRVMPLESIGELVEHGATIALGGTWLSSRPMAAVRQLVRSGRTDLRIVSLTGGLEVDVLIGAGVAREVVFCFVSLGPFGLAPRFGAAAADGSVVVSEHSGHGLTVALEAASRGLGSMPFFGPIGTSLQDRYPTVATPSGGRPVQVAAAEPVDVAILHAEAATADGHVLLAGTIGLDPVTARAASRVVVTTEKLVDRLPQSGSRYLGPANVDAVIVAPWGAHPLAHVPHYGMDWRALLAYAEEAQTAAGFADWLRHDLAGDEQERRERLDDERREVLRLTGSAGGRTSVSLAPHEWVVICLARELHDGDTAILGTFTPIAYAAALLAQHTHAPGLDFNAYGFGGSQLGSLGFLGVEARAHATGYGPVPIEQLVGAMRFRGLVAFEPVRPAQIDGTGAMNLRQLRTPSGRTIRLPGTAGATEVTEMHTRPLAYLPNHTTATCVAAVDDVSLRAHPPNRQRSPFRLVTNLAVLELTGTGWTVSSRHPGVDADALQRATGFAVAGASSAPVTPDPDPDVVSLLREQVDPLGVTATELVGSKERRAMLPSLFEREEQLLREELAGS